MSSIVVGFMPLSGLRILEIHSFRLFLLQAVTYWADILQMTFNIQLQLCPFWNLEYWKYTVFALFSYMLWHIELTFFIWYCVTVLKIKFECRQFLSILLGVLPLSKLRILEIHSFRHFLLHALTYWAEILHITLFQYITEQRRVSSIFVNSCGSYVPFGI